MVDSPDRRAAARYLVPDEIVAEVGGVPVRVLDLSLAGVKVEHEVRFVLTSPELTLAWKGRTVTTPVRVARSEIVGRRESSLVYNTALQIDDQAAQSFIGSILGSTAAEPKPVAPPSESPPAPSFDDTWTRQVRFLRAEIDDHLPYAQFRLTDRGWEKDYVAWPEQPSDGFTVSRDRDDLQELQRTFEAADDETRRMIQIALHTQNEG